MAFDFMGAAKENKKLILSVGGLCLVAFIMSTTGDFFDLWGLDSASLTNNSGPNFTGNLVGIDADAPPVEQAGPVRPVSNGYDGKYFTQPPMKLIEGVDYTAELVTDMGTITVDLFEEIAPINVNNFVFLATEGFYVNTSFHRVISNYIIQAGDPRGDGYGGPGYVVEDEIIDGVDFAPYVVAMANSGVDSNGSQFFITTRNSNTSELNGSYTIIGEVTGGFNVVDSIESVAVNEDKMPYESIILQRVVIPQGY